MSDNTTPPDAEKPPEQQKSWQAEVKQEPQQAQQSHATAADRPSQRATPGRPPLFRT